MAGTGRDGRRGVTSLHREIVSCRVCAQFLPHGPRPVAQFSPTSRIVIIGQAPGSKVHASGIPWNDASGARLCEWTGLTDSQLHDPELVAIVPMGFCYPGKGASGDLPPRKECAPLWHQRVLDELPERQLTLLVGSHAQQRYLPEPRSPRMVDNVSNFGSFGPEFFPLPHPSWRSTLFMQQNPWFEAEVLPRLRDRIAALLA